MDAAHQHIWLHEFGRGGKLGVMSDRPELHRVRIRYCTQCRWLSRAAWIAQELLTTFQTELEVTLEPGVGGIFEVLLDDESLFSRAERRRFPEPKELKQKIRGRIDPDRSLGHSDAAVLEPENEG